MALLFWRHYEAERLILLRHALPPFRHTEGVHVRAPKTTHGRVQRRRRCRTVDISGCLRRLKHCRRRRWPYMWQVHSVNVVLGVVVCVRHAES